MRFASHAIHERVGNKWVTDVIVPIQRYLEVAAVKGNGPPFIKLGRSVRYRVGDLREWIEARRVASTSQGVGQ